MTLHELGALGEFVAAIATLATLIYLAVQIRQNTAHLKMEASLSVQHGQNRVLGLMRDLEVLRAFIKTGEYGSAAPVEDRAIAINWALQYLNHFQAVYDLYEEGALDRERYKLWEGFAASMVATKGIREWWDDEAGKVAFIPAVRDAIDRRLQDADNPPVPLNEMSSIMNTTSWEQGKAGVVGNAP